MKCSRCGAKYKEDPSCGKSTHELLPPMKPKKFNVTMRVVAHTHKVIEAINDTDAEIKAAAQVERDLRKQGYLDIYVET